MIGRVFHKWTQIYCFDDASRTALLKSKISLFGSFCKLINVPIRIHYMISYVKIYVGLNSMYKLKLPKIVHWVHLRQGKFFFFQLLRTCFGAVLSFFVFICLTMLRVSKIKIHTQILWHTSYPMFTHYLWWHIVFWPPPVCKTYYFFHIAISTFCVHTITVFNELWKLIWNIKKQHGCLLEVVKLKPIIFMKIFILFLFSIMLIALSLHLCSFLKIPLETFLLGFVWIWCWWGS